MNWARDFDWDSAVKHHSEAVKGIVETLFALVGLVGDSTVSRIPKSLHRAVLLVLRPAESAVRRLIVMAARGVVVKLVASRPMAKGRKIGKGEGDRLPSFQLYDTRKDFPELRQRRVKYAKNPPRIHFFPYDTLVPRTLSVAVSPPPPDGLASAVRLVRRLQVLKLALDDLPRQAKRMARWRLRRDAMPGFVFRSPLRPGPPPGRRKRQIHPIDEILADCHALAWEALKPDTS
jgi:hypothetical protein